jgi:hypothetical protein
MKEDDLFDNSQFKTKNSKLQLLVCVRGENQCFEKGGTASLIDILSYMQ